MAKKNILKNISRYFSSSLYTTILGVINAFIKPRLLSPENFGLWNILNIIPLYASYSHLGTRTAMRYLLPLKLAEQSHQNVNQIKGNVFYGSLCITLLISVVLFFLGIFGKFTIEVQFGLFTMAIVVLLEWYYLTYVSVLKGYQQFKLLTQVFYLKSTLSFVIGVSLIYFFGIFGLYIALIVALTLTNIYLRSKFSLGRRLSFSSQQFYNLVKQGFPMLLFSLGTLLIGTSDRIIISTLLGNEQLGFYGIAIMILGFFLTIPGSTREVMEPALMESVNSNSMLENTTEFFLKPLINLAYFLPLLIGPVIFIVPILIPIVLPNYIDGILPTQIMMIGGYFLAMSYTTRGIIIANNLQVKAIAIMVLSIPVNVVVSIYFINLELGITGVALGSSISYMVLWLSLLAFIRKHCDYSKHQWRQTMVGILWLLPWLIALIFLLSYAINSGVVNRYVALITALMLYTITIYYLINFAAKRYSLLKSVTFSSLMKHYKS